MIACSARKLLLALLVQSVLVGHAVCICAQLSEAALAGASDAASCPSHGDATAPGDAPRTPDVSCPHCGDHAALSAGAELPAAAFAAVQIATFLSWSSTALLPPREYALAARSADGPVLPAPLQRSCVLRI